MQAEMEVEAYGVPWWLVLIEGIVAVVLGLLLLFFTADAVTLLMRILGIYWLVVGLLAIVQRMVGRSQERWIWVLIKAILGILAGLIVIAYPLLGGVVVPSIILMILGGLGVLMGVVGLVQGMRAGSWAAGIGGIISILIGFVLLANPVVALKIIVWMIAFVAIVGGVVAIYGSFRLRKA